jgi:hypothetical protein
MEENTPNHGASESVIRFACEFCGKQVLAPDSCAGKKARCPQCKKFLVIPSLTPLPAVQQDDEPIRLKRDSVMPAETDRPIYEAPPQHRMAPEPDQDVPASFVRPPEYKPATLVDVFAFPFSLSGILHFVIFWFGPFLLNFFERIFAYSCCYFQLLVLGIYIVLIGYFYYYFSSCIIAAAKDERRAPDLSFEDVPGAGDLARRFFLILVGTLLCFGPMMIYVFCFYWLPGWNGRSAGNWQGDSVYWSLYGLGIFLYPMFILTIAMFDSVAALNPLLIISSIFSTFLPYCGLTLLFFVIGLLMNFASRLQPGGLPLLAWGFDIYLVFIATYILGRFFLRCEDRLNWEVKL